MAEEKKTQPAKTESKPSGDSSASTSASSKDASKSTSSKEAAKNGKGDAPRNIFSETFRSNFEGIDWSK